MTRLNTRKRSGLSRRTLLGGAAGLGTAAALAPALAARPAWAARGRQASGTVRLTWAPSSPAERTAFEEILATFQEKNPAVTVTFEPVSSEYPTKLQADLAAGNAADIFAVDSMLAPDLIAANVMEPVEGRLASSGLAPEQFLPSLLTAYQADGKIYALPKDFSTLAMFAAPEVLSEAGVTAPPTTWEELRTVAQQLFDATGQAQVIFPPSFDRYIVFHYQGGGKVLSDDGTQIAIDSPEAVAALEYYYNLYNDGLSASHTDVGGQWAGDAFAKDLGAIVFEGPWLLPYLEENAPDKEFDLAELPAGPAGKATMAFTVGWAINSKSQVKDAAWALVSYLCGPEGMTAWSTRSGLLPSRPDIAGPYLEQFPDRQPFLAGGEYSRPFQFGQGGQKFNTDATAEIEALYAGQKSPQETIQALQQKAEEGIRLG